MPSGLTTVQSLGWAERGVLLLACIWRNRPDLKVKILQNHDSIFGRHRGMNKTYEAMRHYQWPNMKGEVEDYVRKCASQVIKTQRLKGKARWKLRPRPNKLQSSALDIVGP
jgi:hypothetical protein